MGVMENVATEAILSPIERVTDFELMQMWRNAPEILGYVNDYYYRYLTQISDYSPGVVQEISTVAMRMNQDFISPWLDALQSQIDMITRSNLSLYGSFWNFITDTLGISYNSAGSVYKVMTGGWITRVTDRLKDLEAKADVFTDEQMDKLNWLIENYESFNRLLTDDISYVLNEVMNQIEPLITARVEQVIAPFNNRLLEVETALGKTQFWFWDLLLDVWAFLAGGSILPIDQIEDSMLVIGDWFIEMVFKITDPIEEDIDDITAWAIQHIFDTETDIYNIVIEEIAKIDTLTGGQTATVQAMISAAITNTGGGVGPPGPPGPMGDIGPAGPAGPIGPPGEGDGKDVATINRELYNELWNADAITTNKVTGVIDWMLQAYGTRFGDLQDQLTPITEFFTDEMKTDLTGLVDKFGSPEAIITFLIPESEGQEAEVLDLMQVLIAMTFERGV